MYNFTAWKDSFQSQQCPALTWLGIIVKRIQIVKGEIGGS